MAVWPLPDQPDPNVRDTIRGLFSGFDARSSAEQELIRRCMEHQGFRYVKNPPAGKDVHPTMGPDTYLLSIADAKQYGYAATRDDEEPGDIAAGESASKEGMSATDRQKWHQALVGARPHRRSRSTSVIKW